MNWVFESILLGIALSFTTGTTFISLLNLSLRRGYRHGISFAFGVFLSDLLFIGLILYGISDFYQQENFNRPFSLIGGIGIVLYGLRLLFKHEDEIRIGIENETGLVLSSVISGILINIFNPLAFVFWLAVMSIAPNEKGILGLFLLLFTMFLSDCFKAILIDSYRKQLPPNLFRYLNLLMGILLILLGVRLLIME